MIKPIIGIFINISSLITYEKVSGQIETKAINEFNESMKKEEKKKEINENKEKESLSTILSDLNLNSNSKNNDSNKVKNNNNNFNGENLTNKDNNDEFGFESAVRLKPMTKNNRRGSARKFLEENQNNMNMNKIGNNNNQHNPNNERKLKYNLSNNLMTGLYFDKNEYTKPTIVRNEHSFIVNGNDIFEAKPKKAFEVNSNKFKNLDSNFRKAITLTNNNNNYPYYLNKQKRAANFYQNENNWNL